MPVAQVWESEAAWLHALAEDLRWETCEQTVPVQNYIRPELPNPWFSIAVHWNGQSDRQPEAWGATAHELSLRPIRVILTN